MKENFLNLIANKTFLHIFLSGTSSGVVDGHD